MRSRFRDLMLLHFLNDGVRTVFVVLLVYIAKDFHLSYSMVGFLSSSQPLVAALVAFPAGYIVSKTGGFAFLTKLLIIYSIGALAIALSPNVAVLTFAFILGALGFGMFHTAGFIAIARVADKQEMGRRMSDFMSIGDVGRIILPPLSLYLGSLIGWRPTVAVIAVIGFISYGIARQNLSSNSNEGQAKTGEKRESYQEFVRQAVILIKTKRVVLVMMGSILDALASSALYVYLPFLVLAKGINPLQLSIITGGFFFGSLAGKWLLGRVADKKGNKNIFMLSELGMSTVLILLIHTSSFFILFLLTFILGGFTKGTSPVLQTMFSKLTHADHYNKIYSISEFVLGVSAMTTLIGMGFIADRSGVATVFYLGAVLAILAIVPILAIRFIRSQ